MRPTGLMIHYAEVATKGKNRPKFIKRLAGNVKLALAGDRVLRRVPEFEDCAALARKTGVPVRDILAAASGGPVEDA